MNNHKQADESVTSLRWLPWWVSGGYLILSVIYILVSDRLLIMMVGDPQWVNRIQSIKGIAFVSTTAIVLLFVLHLGISRLIQQQKRLTHSERQSRQLAEIRRRLINELDHRVKNNLANLYSLISLYARSSQSSEDLAGKLQGKVMAIKTVHEMMASLEGKGIDLEQLGRTLLSMFEEPAQPQRIKLEGPMVQLTPRQAHPLAMVLQELGQNSHKHGALAGPTGCVHLNWRTEPRPQQSAANLQPGQGRMLVMHWREEHDRVLPDKPQRNVGLNLVHGLISHELNGQCDCRFDQPGFCCDITLPLEALDSDDAPATALSPESEATTSRITPSA